MSALDQAHALGRSRALVADYEEADLIAEVEALYHDDAGDEFGSIVEGALETFRLRRHALSGALGRRSRRRLVAVDVEDLAATLAAAGPALDDVTRDGLVERLVARAPDLESEVRSPGAPRIAVGGSESPTFSARARRPETGNGAPGNSGAAARRSRKVDE